LAGIALPSLPVNAGCPDNRAVFFNVDSIGPGDDSLPFTALNDPKGPQVRILERGSYVAASIYKGGAS